MMNTVMRRGYQDIFQPAHLIYKFSMNKDAPDLGGRVHKNNIKRHETKQGKRDKINKPVQRLKYRRTKTNRKIKLLRGMMGYVYGPEQSYFMIKPMQPVVKKIF